MPERDDGLRFIVFKDAKSGLVEVGNQAALVVRHGRVEKDFIHFFFENKHAVVFTGTLHRRGGLRRHWWRRCDLILRWRHDRAKE